MDIYSILFKAFIFLYAVILHEVAHGWVAKWRGDSTAEVAGRLTLNPLVHVDVVGSLVVPALLFVISRGTMVFGWARPVPVNPYNFPSPRRDMMMCAAAGPLSNILFALGLVFLVKIGLVIPGTMAWGPVVFGVLINAYLALFNLLPVPPLDGSKVVMGVLPSSLARRYASLEPYGFLLVVMIFMMVGPLLSRVVVLLVGALLESALG